MYLLWGCHNKVPQTGWLPQQKLTFLTVLGAGSTRSWQGWFLLRPLSLICDGHLLCIFPLCLTVSRFPLLFFFLRFYLFIFRERGREGERETSMCGCPLLGNWPTTQTCAPTRNQTSDPLPRSLVLNQLSHTSQGVLLKRTPVVLDPSSP